MGYYGRERSPYYDRYRGPPPRRDEHDIVREPPSRCSLLVRNISRDTRAEEIRHIAEKYGKVRDVYMPVDYYTREPKGIGFVEYYNADDAEDAKHNMDRIQLRGRELQVVFAKQGRKRPDDYRRRGAPPRRPLYRSPVRRRRSFSRSPRRRSPSRSLSRSRSRSRDPEGRASPYDRERERDDRERDRDAAPDRERDYDERKRDEGGDREMEDRRDEGERRNFDERDREFDDRPRDDDDREDNGAQPRRYDEENDQPDDDYPRE